MAHMLEGCRSVLRESKYARSQTSQEDVRCLGAAQMRTGGGRIIAGTVLTCFGPRRAYNLRDQQAPSSSLHRVRMHSTVPPNLNLQATPFERISRRNRRESAMYILGVCASSHHQY